MLNNEIKKIFLNCFNFLKSITFNVIIKKDFRCQLGEIDIVNNFITIHCCGVEAPIKLSFDEIINDVVMLSNFSSKQASWIGYYYGKYYKVLIRQNRKCSIPFSLSPNNSPKKCSITTVTRNGDLTYLDNASNTEHTMNPIRIMANKNLIMKFEPIQACYIGILAGISKEKIINRKSTAFDQATSLKLVR